MRWLLLTLLAGCGGTTRIVAFEPQPDGAVDLVLAEAAPTPTLGGLFSRRSACVAGDQKAAPNQAHRGAGPAACEVDPYGYRIRWLPAREPVINPESTQPTAPTWGLPPVEHLPAGAGAQAVLRRQGEAVAWWIWPDRVEARGGRAPTALALDARQPAEVVPLVGPYAVVKQSTSAWWLDADHGIVVPLAAADAQVLAGGPDGALLLDTPGVGHQLRLTDGHLIPLPAPAAAIGFASDAAWVDDGGAMLLRVDLRRGTLSRRAPVAGYPRLLGIDAGGYLWLNRTAGVAPGADLALVRWHPTTGALLPVRLPSRP